ncbi:MAG: transporter substrate-binding domain-containing protein [Putridiphycobacter sp.]
MKKSLFLILFLGLSWMVTAQIELTQAEQNWLDENPEILFAYDTDWQPISFIDEKGDYSGIAKDYLDLIGTKLNVSFKPYPNITSWSEALDLLKNQKVLLIPALGENKKRDEFIDFTTPYAIYPFVIVTKKDGDFVSNIHDLMDKKVVMPKDFYSTDLLMEKLPNLQLSQKYGVHDCLMDVASGQADATIENLAVISHYLNYNGFENLKIASPADLPQNKIKMGVSKHHPELISVLQKGLDAITPKEKNEIIQNWTSVKFEHGVNMKKVWLFAGITLMVVVLVLGSFLYWNRKLKKEIKTRQLTEKKLNLTLDELSAQHKIIEHRNYEVTSSITYAQRVQNAILPPFDFIFDVFKNAFVLFLPKDIVSGDFYYMETKNNDNQVFFSVADCTGHGVPGAMVSMICYDTLHEAVIEQDLNHPNEILEFAKQSLISRFEKSGKNIKDGMDISFCSLDKLNLKLEWAGAYNPLWVVRHNDYLSISEAYCATNDKSKIYPFEQYHIIELKANRQPVGKYENSKPFRNHTMELIKNDAIYLSSDGYYDQFGGAEGRKMKTKTLRLLLTEIQNLSSKDQHSKLKNYYQNWQGNYEQIDDVCIFGVTV